MLFDYKTRYVAACWKIGLIQSAKVDVHVKKVHSKESHKGLACMVHAY